MSAPAAGGLTGDGGDWKPEKKLEDGEDDLRKRAELTDWLEIDNLVGF